MSFMIFEIILVIFLLICIAILLLILQKNSSYVGIGNLFVSSKGLYYHEIVLCHHTKKCLNHLYRQVKSSNINSQFAENIFNRLRFLLPDKGLHVREREYLHFLIEYIRKELFLNLKEGNYLTQKNATQQENSRNFNNLINIQSLLEQLDWTAAEQEKRINCLLKFTQNYIVAQHYMKLPFCINVARKIQNANGRLLKNILRTEKGLLKISREAKIKVLPKTTKSRYIQPGQ